jgi:hypothetical protein
MHGIEEGRVRWSPAFLRQRPADALLRYLAVAHFGRGRGEWSEGEHPSHWRNAVLTVLERRAQQWESATGDAQALQAAMAESARDVLEHLYPESRALLLKSRA